MKAKRSNCQTRWAPRCDHCGQVVQDKWRAHKVKIRAAAAPGKVAHCFDGEVGTIREAFRHYALIVRRPQDEHEWAAYWYDIRKIEKS